MTPTASWSLPGRQADPAAWQIDLKDGLIPPGQAAPQGQTQVTYPRGIRPNPAKVMFLHSPKGHQAPKHLVNIEPSTGKVYAPGAQAPIDNHQVSLLPTGQTPPMGAPTPPMAAPPAPVGVGDDGDNSDQTNTGSFDPGVPDVESGSAAGDGGAATIPVVSGLQGFFQSVFGGGAGPQPAAGGPAVDPNQVAPPTDPNFDPNAPITATPVLDGKGQVIGYQAGSGAVHYLTPTEIAAANQATGPAAHGGVDRVVTNPRTKVQTLYYKDGTSTVLDANGQATTTTPSGAAPAGTSAGNGGQQKSDIERFADAVAQEFGPEAGKAALAQARYETLNGTVFPVGPNGPQSATYNYAAWGGVNDSQGHAAYATPEAGAQGYINWIQSNPRYSKYIQDAQGGADAATLVQDLYSRYQLSDGSAGGGWAESPTAGQNIVGMLDSPPPQGGFQSSGSGATGPGGDSSGGYVYDQYGNSHYVPAKAAWTGGTFTDSQGNTYEKNSLTGETRLLIPAGPQTQTLSPGQTLGMVDPKTGAFTKSYTAPQAPSTFGLGRSEYQYDPESNSTKTLASNTDPVSMGNDVFLPPGNATKVNYGDVSPDLKGYEVGQGDDPLPGAAWAGPGPMRRPGSTPPPPIFGGSRVTPQAPIAGGLITTPAPPLTGGLWTTPSTAAGDSTQSETDLPPLPTSRDGQQIAEQQLDQPVTVVPGGDWSAAFNLDQRTTPPPQLPTIDPRARHYDAGVGEGDDDMGASAAWAAPVDPAKAVGTGTGFGETSPVSGSQHQGVDVQALDGTPVNSPIDGTVHIERHPKGGLVLYIIDAKGKRHFVKLAHLLAVTVKEGDPVKKGQSVAQVGHSGSANTGANLHIEESQNGQPVDPTAKLGPLAQMPDRSGAVGNDSTWRPRMQGKGWKKGLAKKKVGVGDDWYNDPGADSGDTSSWSDPSTVGQGTKITPYKPPAASGYGYDPAGDLGYDPNTGLSGPGDPSSYTPSSSPSDFGPTPQPAPAPQASWTDTSWANGDPSVQATFDSYANSIGYSGGGAALWQAQNAQNQGGGGGGGGGAPSPAGGGVSLPASGSPFPVNNADTWGNAMGSALGGAGNAAQSWLQSQLGPGVQPGNPLEWAQGQAASNSSPDPYNSQFLYNPSAAAGPTNDRGAASASDLSSAWAALPPPPSQPADTQAIAWPAPTETPPPEGGITMPDSTASNDRGAATAPNLSAGWATPSAGVGGLAAKPNVVPAAANAPVAGSTRTAAQLSSEPNAPWSPNKSAPATSSSGGAPAPTPAGQPQPNAVPNTVPAGPAGANLAAVVPTAKGPQTVQQIITALRGAKNGDPLESMPTQAVVDKYNQTVQGAGKAGVPTDPTGQGQLGISPSYAAYLSAQEKQFVANLQFSYTQLGQAQQQFLMQSALSNPWLAALGSISPGGNPNWNSPGEPAAASLASGLDPTKVPMYSKLTGASPFARAAWITAYMWNTGLPYAQVMQQIQTQAQSEGHPGIAPMTQLAWAGASPTDKVGQEQLNEAWGSNLQTQQANLAPSWAASAPVAVAVS